MPPLTVHAVQSYVKTKRGRIGQASLRECQSPASAKRLAERLVENGQAVGASAFSQTFNSATGDLEELRVIGSYGTVCNPEDELPF